ncbi:MAG TPA: hypothetical protein VGZ93_06850 [Candidatus Methylacidiphilales bacterium]|jgi:hypothetical protein|nr:hypothetical protein [Candidatus Methylacidiphilales bacterium]
MRRLAHILVLAAFVFSCGGQWYVLQCVAWVKMLHDYSQMVPFTEAVGMTFSGKYPCPICKAIAEKKQSENDKLCSLEKYEKKFFPPVEIAPVRPDSAPFRYPVCLNSLEFRTESPPTPPPRQALG